MQGDQHLTVNHTYNFVDPVTAGAVEGGLYLGGGGGSGQTIITFMHIHNYGSTPKYRIPWLHPQLRLMRSASSLCTCKMKQLLNRLCVTQIRKKSSHRRKSAFLTNCMLLEWLEITLTVCVLQKACFDFYELPLPCILCECS